MIIKTTHEYEKQYKRLKRSGAKMTKLVAVVKAFYEDNRVELNRLHDYQLLDQFNGQREVHVGQRSSDWVLRHQICDGRLERLVLATGTHHTALSTN